MPPKTGTKGKKGSKAKKARPTDDMTVDLTGKIEELEKQVTALTAELQQERESRNYFQLERTKSSLCTKFPLHSSRRHALISAPRTESSRSWLRIIRSQSKHTNRRSSQSSTQTLTKQLSLRSRQNRRCEQRRTFTALARQSSFVRSMP